MGKRRALPLHVSDVVEKSADVARGNRHYRVIAGTLELLIGAYCVTFGVLATFVFSRMHHVTIARLSVAASLFGVLLVFRSGRLLGWKRWFFWLMTLPLLAIPIMKYLPVLTSAH